ncbi:UDP-glucose--hexose-1-phosphate uridylyltransferase [Luminiphilus sp.]|nr:UDP-glucose--hexose-1-phosphate uridylyltransferase [Luminiphilus sp.]
MSQFDPENHSHRRFNPLTGSWVLVSPHRSKRPWQGQEERPAVDARPAYDANCYLCPGNERAGGVKNPDYSGPYVFQNDFSALLPNVPLSAAADHELLVSASESGLCRVICFSPRHDLTLPQMSHEELCKVVDLWAVQYQELAAMDGINHVQIFENKGEAMGCSNPHPHGQIWAQQTVPDEAAKKTQRMQAHLERTGHTLLGDYRTVELERASRLVCDNESFVALVPFWATWPFETLVLCKRHLRNLSDMTDAERSDLADILKRLTTRYDNLFECSFPYSAGMHQAPTDGAEHDAWDWHMHFYPPMLRSASVKKFMVGYEMLGEPQRDITPEAAAERLRALSETHYTR